MNLTDNIDKIRALAQIVKENDLSSLTLEKDGSLRMERLPAAPAVLYPAPAAPEAIQIAAAPAPALQLAAEIPAAVAAPAGKAIPSSLVGVFYSAPAPGAKSFVEVGSKFKAGDVLCIVEAMKLMNEIVAEHDGEIAEICAENGQVVEFGQVLFRYV